MSDIKRYFIYSNSGYEVGKDVDGDWVEYDDVEPAIKLYDIIKDKVKFDGGKCLLKECIFGLQNDLDCPFVNRKIGEVDPYFANCLRCQQCIDIFGGVE